MTATLERLGIDRMTVVERIALAQEILDSVAAEQPRPTLSEAKRANWTVASPIMRRTRGMEFRGRTLRLRPSRIRPMNLPVILRRICAS